jgi:hypothetical protein
VLKIGTVGIVKADPSQVQYYQPSERT